MANNKPAHEIRLGRIKAVIWENETAAGPRYNVNIVRLYKDGDQWKDSTSYGRDDLAIVAIVSEAALKWAYEKKSE